MPDLGVGICRADLLGHGPGVESLRQHRCKGYGLHRENARDLRTVSRLAFADAVIFPAGMLIVAYLGAGSAPLTLLITPLVTFFCLAAGIVLYVLSRLVADAAALREDNDLTI